MTGLYWSNITLLNCRAHANIHIVVIGCIFLLLLSHCCKFLLCLFHYWEESAQHIFTYSSKHRSAASGSFGWVWSTEAMSSSLKLHPGDLNCRTLALQLHAGQTAVLQDVTWGHIRSNVYSTTKIFVNGFLLCIMSTNRCNPNMDKI